MEEQFDKIINDMRIDQSLGGILIAQAFVDYCQALINAQIAETDGSELFGLLENATLSPKHTDINHLVREAIDWKANNLICNS